MALSDWEELPPREGDTVDVTMTNVDDPETIGAVNIINDLSRSAYVGLLNEHGSEITGPGYQRVLAEFDVGQSIHVDFPPATGRWGMVRYIGLFSQEEGGIADIGVITLTHSPRAIAEGGSVHVDIPISEATPPEFFSFSSSTTDEDCPACDVGILMYGNHSGEWLPCMICGHERDD